MKAKRIAVLFHEADKARAADGYIISHLANYWREDGHEVIFLFGVSDFEPADILIVHVDLSVVPEPYLEFAQRYPISVNGQVSDIRKSAYSPEILGPDDTYSGKVIVKTDLNYAGEPEARILGDKHRHPMKNPMHYAVFDDLSFVPRSYRLNPELVVQKFLPEMDQGLFCVRHYQFFGANSYCTRLKSECGIVNFTNQKSTEDVEPHPSIVEMRKKLKIDYGKIDYVINEGNAILLDVNKTMGAGALVRTPKFDALRRYRAEGLYSFFEEPALLNS